MSFVSLFTLGFVILVSVDARCSDQYEPRRPQRRPERVSEEFGIDCSKQENEVKLHAHPTSCTRYLQCKHGSAIARPCAAGTEFSPSVGVCVLRKNSGCTVGKRIGKPEEVEKPEEVKPITEEIPNNFEEFSEVSGKPESAEKQEKSEESEQPEGSEESGNPEAPEKSDEPDTPEEPLEYGNPEEAGKLEAPENPETTHEHKESKNPDTTKLPKDSENPEVTHKPEESEKPVQSEEPEESVKAPIKANESFNTSEYYLSSESEESDESDSSDSGSHEYK